jgi:antitoxin (DNA-binding transcriptional repressor) of toxin-antitoxin stability system
MSTVTVREFAYNPSAMFARVEKGETIEVTRHGKVIATLIPAQRQPKSRHDELVERGLIRPVPRKSWDELTHIDVPDDVDPLAVLLEIREHER